MKRYELIPDHILSSRMRQLMDRLGHTDRSEGGGGWTPAVDIFETEDEVVIVAEVAGIAREHIKVIVDGQVVRLYGQREATCCTAGAQYHRMEIASGAFARSFRIPVPFVGGQVEAKAADGLLYVHLPKDKQPARQSIDVENA